MINPRQLLMEIARCTVAEDLLRPGCSAHNCCRTIVSSQGTRSFQLPEPWVGRIELAPILFISSNPSINEEEAYPDEHWDEERIVDFFQNRFTSAFGWVKDGKVRQGNGYSLRRVRFWAAARNRACELLEKTKDEVEPGVDFALTEVVHCKSRGEIGVEEAKDLCATRYLERVLAISVARVFVVLGKTAREVVQHHIFRGLEPTLAQPLIGPLDIADVPRMVAFLPHPSARRGVKTLAGNLGSELSLLRRHLRQNLGP